MTDLRITGIYPHLHIPQHKPSRHTTPPEIQCTPVMGSDYNRLSRYSPQIDSVKLAITVQHAVRDNVASSTSGTHTSLQSHTTFSHWYPTPTLHVHTGINKLPHWYPGQQSTVAAREHRSNKSPAVLGAYSQPPRPLMISSATAISTPSRASSPPQ